MGKILTISIAGYNVQDYIRNTLDSLIDASIIDDLEIFVVDDGGKDDTLKIVEEYSAAYPDSIFGIHKENGGYGSVINKSVELATGKYFKQLDGDDWFDTSCLKKMVELLKDLEADAVYTAVNEVYEEDGRIVPVDHFSHLAEGAYVFEETELRSIISMHETTYRTQLLKEQKQPVTEHCFYTDVEYITRPFAVAKNFYVIHEPLYQYRLGREGQSVSPEGIKKHYKEHELVFWNLVQMYQQMGNDLKSHRMVVFLRLRKEFVSHLKYLCMLPNSSETKQELREYMNRVKKEIPDVYKDAGKYSKFAKLLILSNGQSYAVMKRFLK